MTDSIKQQQAFEFIKPEYPDNSTPRARFVIFHAANPWVFEELHKLATQAKRKGYKHFSIEALFNILRWERYIPTEDPNSEWKLNNNYKPFYSRLIMSHDPQLEGFFLLRESVADED